MSKANSKRRVRLRSKRKSRARMEGKIRIIVRRSNRHMRAQIVDVNGRVVGGASTLTPSIKQKISYPGNKDAAKEVGVAIAAIAKKLKLVENLAFDRSGLPYHGRVAMLAEGIRSANINI